MAFFRFRKRVKKKKEVPLTKKHARVLKIVAAINAVMFGVEAAFGYIAHSTALISDSVDMLGDAVGAGAGVLVRKSSPRKQAWVALGKAVAMGALGLGVLTGAALLLANPVVMPIAATMAIVGGLALAANTTCALLLWRYRNDNINIKATLTCTRNDMISNAGVLVAAGVGRLLLSPIPDIAVGIVVAGLFVKSSIGIAREAIKILWPRKGARKEKTKTPAAAARTAEPKMKFGFKKALRAVFNRKADKAQKTPVTAPAEKPVVNKQGGNTPHKKPAPAVAA